ncbi:MAG TPA: hypothetical protein VGG19_11710 [Tepidisphaeraceae bacterium]|jgi:hypothetical protein
MLNELYDLADSLKVAGISPPSWHGHFKSCPHRKTFMVLLNADGRVARIEIIDDATEIKKYEVANGQSFPSFNVPPLYWATTDDARKTVEKLLKDFEKGAVDEAGFVASIQALIAQSAPLWDDEILYRITNCLGKTSERLMAQIGDVPHEMSSFLELVVRSKKISAKSFGDDLCSAALELAKSSPKQTKDIVQSLIISTEKKKEKANGLKPSLIVELLDRDQFNYPANHQKIQEWVNSRLMANEGAKSCPDSKVQLDAFGTAAEGYEEKFPSVQLPLRWTVIIRAMNDEAPCQRRYGLAESFSFHVGQEARQRMKNALEWLGGEERRGKTWQDISGACGYDRGLLFAYPSVLPSLPQEMAEFATLAADDLQQEAQFEAVAERVVKSLEGIAKEHPEVEVRVFALAKADRARTKLLAEVSSNAVTYIRAAERWQEGRLNLPPLRLYLGSPEPIEPATPFPIRLAGDLNNVWIRGGESVDTAKELTVGDGLRLLLDSGAAEHRSAAKYLSALVRNAIPLFLRAGHADHFGIGHKFWQDMEGSAKAAARSLPRMLGTIGLLLWKLGRRKEEYMHTPCFLVGQFLALSDLLHREYCRNVRKGDIPNQLIGNAMMPVALDNPQRAVTRLNDRLMVYQRWAFTSDGDIESNRFGKWVLKRLGLISGELGTTTLPIKAGDAEKAQILLGYLARQESETGSN